MRLQLTKIVKETDYFLHADMWNLTNFPIKGEVINSGLGEANLLNIAGGIASEGNTVFIYGVAGFIIHRYEQLKFSCKHFGAKSGKIIICNAGKYGYEKLGLGHFMDDDEAICDAIGIEFYAPKSTNELTDMLFDIENRDKGIFYIQLGRDE